MSTCTQGKTLDIPGNRS